jgi:hypothetical protein
MERKRGERNKQLKLTQKKKRKKEIRKNKKGERKK